MVTHDRGDLGGDVGRPEGDGVGLDQDSGGAADAERRAELLGSVCVTDREHGRLPAGRSCDLHGELDGAVVVVAERVPDEARVRGLRVLGQQHLTREVRHPLDADEHVASIRRGHLIRSLPGSSSGVASTEPTVTG